MYKFIDRNTGTDKKIQWSNSGTPLDMQYEVTGRDVQTVASFARPIFLGGPGASQV